MSKSILKRWVAVAVFASISLTPGLTQDISNVLSPAEWAQLQSMYGGSLGLGSNPTVPTAMADLASEMVKCLCDSSTEVPQSSEVPAIQNAPLTQNFIQLAQPEVDPTAAMNYASPSYSATDLQGDIGDSEVSEDSY